jgi:hypothetical protein
MLEALNEPFKLFAGSRAALGLTVSLPGSGKDCVLGLPPKKRTQECVFLAGLPLGLSAKGYATVKIRYPA